MNAVCAGAYCVSRPRICLPGLLLCRACLTETTRGLRRLAGLYQHCERLLEGPARGHVRDKVSGSAVPGLQFNCAAADARSTILSVLSSWSGLVAEARAVSAPARTAPALSGFLLRHARWLAAHEAAPELTSEIRQLVSSASKIAFPSRPQRIFVGRCPQDDCGGSLFATIEGQDTSLPAEIGCDAELEHSWPARAWLSLGRQIGGEPGETARPWLSAQEISRLRDAKPGSIYRLASERQWRRRREAGHTYYYAADVEETFRQLG
jgi:hypothetical protein